MNLKHKNILNSNGKTSLSKFRKARNYFSKLTTSPIQTLYISLILPVTHNGAAAGTPHKQAHGK